MKKYIWYEKYRPASLKEIALDKKVKQNLEKYIEDRNIPHLFFYGPRGSGKTTTAFILMREIKSVKLILNASSSDRGIAVVKGKIKQFAQSKTIDESSLKIVFLDEADGMTPDAQRGLKNTMEMYSDTCRFILTANNKDRVIEEIRSRCTSYKFSKYPEDDLFGYLCFILARERVTFKEEDVYELIDRYSPDIRTMINQLQACSYKGNLNIKDVLDGIEDLSKIEKWILGGRISELRKSFSGLTDFIWFYKYLFDEFIYNSVKEDDIRSEIALSIASFLYQDGLVADREINLAGCLIDIMRIMKIKVRW